MAKSSGGQGLKWKGICDLIENFRKEVAEIKRRKDRESRSVVLTYEAAKLHYRFEGVMSNLRKLAEKHSDCLTENLPFLTVESVLPDLLVAAILWFDEDELLDKVDQLLGCLVCLLSGSGKKHLTCFGIYEVVRMERLQPDIFS